MVQKKETKAEDFMRRIRKMYSQLFPTNFHVILRLLAFSDYKWDAEGGIVRTYDEVWGVPDLTEAGWESVKNNSLCPTSWPMPNPESPILNIPDHADESWLQEISMFLFHLEQWNPVDVDTWITTHVRLNSTGRNHQDSAIERNRKGYHAVLGAVMADKLGSRIRLVRELKASPRPKKEPVVEPGATVRFRTGVDETAVRELIKTPSAHYTGGESMRLAVLESAINGSNIHVVDNLVATKFPPNNEENKHEG